MVRCDASDTTVSHMGGVDYLLIRVGTSLAIRHFGPQCHDTGVHVKSGSGTSGYIVRVSDSMRQFGNHDINSVSSQAFRIMNDPVSTPEQLRYVITVAPELTVGVAMHPQLDEALRSWLWDSGDLQVRQIIYDRFAREVETAQAHGLPIPQDVVDYCKVVIAAAELSPAARDDQENDPDLITEPAPMTMIIPRVELPSVVFGTILLPTGETIELTYDRVLVGRSPLDRGSGPSQLVAIDDPDRFVSANHVLLEYVEGVWYVTDLGSTNGTAVVGFGDKPIPQGEPVAVDGALNLGGYVLILSGMASGLPQVDTEEGEATQFYSPDMTGTALPAMPQVLGTLISDFGDETQLVTTPVLIGRNPDPYVVPSAQIVKVDDLTLTMSKTHARLDYIEDQWYITDMGAANGVAVQTDDCLVEIDADVPMVLNGTFALGDRTFLLVTAD